MKRYCEKNLKKEIYKDLVDQMADDFEDSCEYVLEDNSHAMTVESAEAIYRTFEKIPDDEKKAAWDALVEELTERGLKVDQSLLEEDVQ